MIKIKYHKARKLVYALAGVMSIVVFILIIYFSQFPLRNITIKDIFASIIAEDDWIIPIFKYLGGLGAIVLLIIVAVAIFISFYQLNIRALAYDIKVSDKQFKELLDFEIECAEKLGLEEIPTLYIDTIGDELTIIRGARFDNKHILRIIDAEVHCTAKEGYYAAKFTIARKMAAIKLGYYDILPNIIGIFSNWIPILSQLNYRLMCYECDTVATAIVGKENAINALFIKNTGFYITPLVNKEEFINNLEAVVNNKQIILENIMLRTPVLAYRIEAILNDTDGRLF